MTMGLRTFLRKLLRRRENRVEWYLETPLTWTTEEIKLDDPAPLDLDSISVQCFVNEAKEETE